MEKNLKNNFIERNRIDVGDIMDDFILAELKEQTKWLRFLALPDLKKTLIENLQTKEQKGIYNLTDGKNSTNDISNELDDKNIKVSHMTVYNYWKRWYALGIVIPSEQYSGRYSTFVKLSDLNIQ